MMLAAALLAGGAVTAQEDDTHSGEDVAPPDGFRANRIEAYERDLLRSGEHRFRDVYPLSPALRREYERDR